MVWFNFDCCGANCFGPLRVGTPTSLRFRILLLSLFCYAIRGGAGMICAGITHGLLVYAQYVVTYVILLPWFEMSVQVGSYDCMIAAPQAHGD
eukprot:SAG31_NODE_11709_length_1004_cov_2.230939_1_plen_93_part_00